MEIHTKFIVIVLKYQWKRNILREVFKFLLYFCNDIGNSRRFIISLVIKNVCLRLQYTNSSSQSFSYNTSSNVYLIFIVPNRNIDINSPHKRVPTNALVSVVVPWYLVCLKRLQQHAPL